MASKLAFELVIGAAVNPTVGTVLNAVEDRIKDLEQRGRNASLLKDAVGEAIRLRQQWKQAHDSGSASAAGLLRKLERNLDSLRAQGVQVGKLGKEYQRLGRTARSAELQARGHQQVAEGKESLKSNVDRATTVVRAVAIPTKISADFQSIVRDIAIKAGVAGKPQEAQLARTFIQTSQTTGMARNDVANLVKSLVDNGMQADKAQAYAPLAAKFAVGQGVSGADTAAIITALQNSAGITTPKIMEQALQVIAVQSKAGGFEAVDMAKSFAPLLGKMGTLGTTGLAAVSQVGAMLQVQRSTTGNSDDAAGNLNSWMSGIYSQDTVSAYTKAGIDYQGSMNTGLQKGMSALESSFDLARRYLELTSPEKARKMATATEQISKEADPQTARTLLNALEQSLRTGNTFADAQTSAALMAFTQNQALYKQMRDAKPKEGEGLDHDLQMRRQTSTVIWNEAIGALDDSLRSIGDAIRPLTDTTARVITSVAQAFTTLTDKSQSLVLGIALVGGAVSVLLTALSAVKIGRGALNIGRGVLNAGGVGGRPLEGGQGKASGLMKIGLKVLGVETQNNAQGVLVVNEPLNVFVVNAGDFLGGSGGQGGRRVRRAPRDQKRSGRRTGNRGSLAGYSGPPAPISLKGFTSRGGTASMFRAVSKAAPLVKRLPGGSVIDAGLRIVDTYRNARTTAQKARGYGSAAGGFGGALAGAAAGAALGSVVPVLGTAVGGAIGAMLGGMGGEDLGGWLGKRLFGAGEKPVQVAGSDTKEASAVAVPGEVVRSLAEPSPAAQTLSSLASSTVQSPAPAPQINQQFTFSPNMPITVQGGLSDPAQFAMNVEAIVRRQFDELIRQATSRQLYDVPHVA
ncbi:hypothetical protein PS652_03711 [Pseudomonas fluorescens]|uniref:Phage tail tape measure protein domain-containing protein n=1 Tax=Pseudomonas fluorescens TaxID=294 RepID=A0A5E6S095_PSEFL|nr:hypothetical protein PS652_01929 [Pseudomonas fluorescens]